MNAIVVGGGIYGATGAIELARRGVSVTLVDPGPLPYPDAASTDISKVLRADYGPDAFYTSLMAEAFAGWDAWQASWAERLVHLDGFLLLSKQPLVPGSFEYESLTCVSAHGFPVERMDPAKLRTRFPAWNADLYPDGYLSRRAGWAASGRVVATLLVQAAAAGVNIRANARVTGLIEGDDRVSGVLLADERISADVVVIAAGTWSWTLVPELRPMMRSVGQPVFHFRVDRPQDWQPPQFTTWAADTSRTGWYGFPANDDGILKIANHGPGRDMDPNEPRQVDAESEAKCRAFLAESLPSLVGAPLVSTRLCLYADTFDGDFVIDEVPGRPGLVVATGGSGHGFKFAPVLGRLVAAAALGEPDPRSYRFRFRPVGPRRSEGARFSG